MPWQVEILDCLCSAVPCGYYAHQPAATEPSALAALALLGANRSNEANTALRWLAKIQAADGSLGITATESAPHWPTAWAAIAWAAAGWQRGGESSANGHRHGKALCRRRF